MPKDCANCGSDCIKTKGKYRRLCPECNQKEATDTRHVEQCGLDDCIVCLDKLEVYKSVVGPLYRRIRLESALSGGNRTLSEWE
jgi:hypothetical protein